MLCEDFDLSILVDETRVKANGYLGRNLVEKLQELGISVDQLLSALAIHLDQTQVDQRVVMHLERASEVLRSTGKHSDSIEFFVGD
jgi:hypothetical protein